MLDTKDCLKHHTKNAKATKFLLSQPSTFPKEALAKFYLSTTFSVSFMISSTTFSVSFMISSVAPTRSSTSYAYLITKIENRNLKSGKHFLEHPVGLPNHDHVFTVDNSANINPIHTTHSRSVHTYMISNPLLQKIRRLPDLLNCRVSSEMKRAQF